MCIIDPTNYPPIPTQVCRNLIKICPSVVQMERFESIGNLEETFSRAVPLKIFKAEPDLGFFQKGFLYILIT